MGPRPRRVVGAVSASLRGLFLPWLAERPARERRAAQKAGMAFNAVQAVQDYRRGRRAVQPLLTGRPDWMAHRLALLSAYAAIVASTNAGPKVPGRKLEPLEV